ncbi:MAG: biotin/lipoyl-containing protein, partial [Burkholderiaceae bacterium]
MALHDVKVPQLSESVAEAALLQWKKQPGEAVAQDEILIEIETDKVVLEVPAPAAGVLSEHVKANGDMVVSDEVIARIDTDAKAGASSPSAKPAESAKAAPASPTAAATGSTAAALPAAAKLMAETGVSVA